MSKRKLRGTVYRLFQDDNFQTQCFLPLLFYDNQHRLVKVKI